MSHHLDAMHGMQTTEPDDVKIDRGSKPKSLCKDYEHRLWEQGYQAIAGVDEAGRGPLAGPVSSWRAMQRCCLETAFSLCITPAPMGMVC
jgi:hypothetical protein